LKKLLIVTLLDYGYYANNRVHHIVDQFKSRFDNITILYKKVYIPGTHSLAKQLRIFFNFKTKCFRRENITNIEVDPFFNHVDGLGLYMLKIKNTDISVSSRLVNLAQKTLSNIGIISDLLIVPSFFLAFFLRIRSKVDIYIGQGPFEVAFGYILKKMGMVEILVYDDYDYAPGYHHAKFRRLMVSTLEKFFIKRSDIVISVSELLGKLREKQTGKKVEIIPNGVNYELFSQAQYKRPHPPSLIYMGYVFDWSGIDIILDALAMIRKELPQIRFLVLGHSSPSYLTHIGNKASKLKLGKSFAYIGNKSYTDLVDYLREVDIGMALFRPIELRKYAFSLKVVEYMSAGLPVITTKETQSGYFVEKSNAGISVEYSIDAVTNAIMILLNDKEFYKNCSINAIQTSKTYDWKSTMERYYSLVEYRYAL
jgi:glycosyltransferase involved in cell wall biosynthesis